MKQKVWIKKQFGILIRPDSERDAIALTSVAGYCTVLAEFLGTTVAMLNPL
jgi:hypothetical protein